MMAQRDPPQRLAQLDRPHAVGLRPPRRRRTRGRAASARRPRASSHSSAPPPSRSQNELANAWTSPSRPGAGVRPEGWRPGSKRSTRAHGCAQPPNVSTLVSVVSDDDDLPPLRTCPRCGREGRTRYERCPHCQASYFARSRGQQRRRIADRRRRPGGRRRRARRRLGVRVLATATRARRPRTRAAPGSIRDLRAKMVREQAPHHDAAPQLRPPAGATAAQQLAARRRLLARRPGPDHRRRAGAREGRRARRPRPLHVLRPDPQGQGRRARRPRPDEVDRPLRLRRDQGPRDRRGQQEGRRAGQPVRRRAQLQDLHLHLVPQHARPGRGRRRARLRPPRPRLPRGPRPRARLRLRRARPASRT